MHKIAESLPLSKESADCDVLIDEGQQQQNNPQDVHATLKTSRGDNKEIKVRIQPATYRIKLPTTLDNYPKKSAIVISILHLLLGFSSLAIYLANLMFWRSFQLFFRNTLDVLNPYMLLGNELWSGVVFVATGIFGLIACCTFNKKIAIVFAVTNVNSAVISFYSFIFLVKDIHFMVVSERWNYLQEKYLDISFITIMNSLIAVVLLFEFVVAVVGGVIFNRTACNGTRKSIEVEMDDAENVQ